MPTLGLKNSLASQSISTPAARGSSAYWIIFDGDDDHVSISNSLNSYLGQKDFSLSAWIYHSATSGTIFSSGHISNGYAFRWDISSDKPGFYFGQSGDNIDGTASLALNDNQWYQLGITHDDSEETIKFYVDGSLTDTFTSTDIPGTVHDTNARIGALAEFGQSVELTGRIANVALFSDLVTSAEMSNLASSHDYDATSIGNCVGWWRMGAGTEDGSGTTIYDMSTNSNNGTLSGGSIQSGTI